MMNDLISRQAAIDRIRGTGYADQIKENVIMILMGVPSAQPERKNGKWILETYQIRCSHCNKLFSDNLFPSNYCPNCGARMDGESE